MSEYRCIVCGEELFTDELNIGICMWCENQGCSLYGIALHGKLPEALDEKRRQIENIKKVHSRTTETI